MIEEFEYPELDPNPQYNAVLSVTVAELHDDGFIDLSDGTWDWPKYNAQQDKTLKGKILAHYWYREISLVPPIVWKNELVRKMNEIMPKYIYPYRLIDGSPDLVGASSEYYKSRNIYSDFPQTQLNGSNGDYASTGNDMEFERIRQGDIIEIAERLRTYDDVDLMIINELEPLFSPLISANLNAW